MRVSFNSYDSGHAGEPWALVLDSEARARLADAGIELGKQGRTWSLSDHTEPDIADAIVDVVTRLAAVPLRVLRGADLPPDVDWPWHGLVGLMTADKIVSIATQPNGKHVIVSETAGRRTEAAVGDKDMQLLRWWWHRAGSSVPDKAAMSHTNELVEIRAEEATQRGLPPVSIRVDACAGSMASRKFPTNDVYLMLNGPPGAPLLLMIFDCSGAERDDAALIHSKFVPAWTKELELGVVDRAHILGADQTGVTFATGGGIARTAWFGFVIERGAAKLLITIGVGGRDNLAVSAPEVASNPAIRRVLDTLRIEASY